MPGHLFISYSRADSDYVTKLASFLDDHSVAVWVDSSIDYGDRWEKVIREQIDTCTAFLVVMSPEAEESTWVSNELARAQSRGKPVFPLLLRGDGFFRLGHLQHETVTGGQMPAIRFVERLRDLAAKTPSQRPAPAISKPLSAAEAVKTLTSTLESMRDFEREFRTRLFAYYEQQLKAAEQASDVQAFGANHYLRLSSYLNAQITDLNRFAVPLDSAGYGNSDHAVKLEDFRVEYRSRLYTHLSQQLRDANANLANVKPGGAYEGMAPESIRAELTKQIQTQIDALNAGRPKS